jgi:hypothetical protein
MQTLRMGKMPLNIFKSKNKYSSNSFKDIELILRFHEHSLNYLTSPLIRVWT